MEGPSNGGMLYHEVQESKLCAMHCVNTVLQGPFFSEFDLAALASNLEGGDQFVPEESHKVSHGGDFSIQVLRRALDVWDLQVIPLSCPVSKPAPIDPQLENAFICHLQDHWFCIRKVNGEWYNLDSLYAAPKHLSNFYPSEYLDTLKGSGWSIFLVRGNFPMECPITSSEACKGYGQWLLPEDAERITNSNGQWLLPEDAKSITKSHNSKQRPPHRTDPNQQLFDQFLQYGEAETLSDAEDEVLNAAIAASLMDSSPATATATATASAEAGTSRNDFKHSSEENAEEIFF